MLTVFEAESQVEFTPTVELSRVGRVLCMTLNPPLILKGDVRITLKNKPNVMMLKEKMLHFWFNTFFVRDQVRLPPPSPSPLSLPPSGTGKTISALDSNSSDSAKDVTTAGGVGSETLTAGDNSSSTASLTKADGLALKTRWVSGPSDRPDRSGSCPVNSLTANPLWPSSRHALVPFLLL